MQEKAKNYNTICIGKVKITIGVDSITAIKKEFASSRHQKILIVTDAGVIKHNLLDYLLPSVAEANVDYWIFSETLPNPPLSQVDKVVKLICEKQCDAIVAIGGGSVIDLAKASGAMARNDGNLKNYIHTAKHPKELMQEPLPLYSIPTTSGTGSEVTQYAVITDELTSQKITIGNPKLVSKAVFLDPRLTLSLPPAITASTGVDALAHALEAYTSNRIINAPGSSIISDVLALTALNLILKFLPIAYNDGNNLESRKGMMLGSTIAGLITQAGSGAAHGLSHCLTSCFNVPHGDAIAALLPSIMEFNLPVCNNRYQEIAQSCDSITSIYGTNANANDLIQFIKDLLVSLDIKPLCHYVPKIEQLDAIINLAYMDKCTVLNARSLSLENVTDIYRKSYYS